MNKILKEGKLPSRTGTPIHPANVFKCRRCGTILLSDEYNNKYEERCPLCGQIIKPSFFKTLKFYRFRRKIRKKKRNHYGR